MFHTRTFESFLLAFNIEVEASDVFDSVKDLTVACKEPSRLLGIVR